MEKKRVGIVGAGISGLLACKYVLQKGFEPLVFESDSDVGGVWAHTLASTKLQSPRPVYQFSDFPWPDDVQEIYPHSSQTIEYVRSYARHFDLLRHVKFNSRVVGVNYVGAGEEEREAWTLYGGNGEAFGAHDSNGVWLINVMGNEDQEGCGPQVYELDFLILCIGRFSGLPNLPSFQPNKGPEVFKGKVFHSMDVFNMDNSCFTQLTQDKHVAIVGCMKTALDIATECAKANGGKHPCTMIYRSKHWLIPGFVFKSLPFAICFLSRFSELWLHKPGEGLLLYILATLLSPMIWLTSKCFESYVKWKLPMEKYGMVPNHSLFKDATACAIAVLPDNFYNKVEEGSIILKQCKSFTFHENGIITDDGVTTEADVVIFATGFKGDQKIRDIFTSNNFKKIVTGSSSTAVPLYRECIHTRIPQMAIIGYSESLANLYTSELRCKWLAHFLDGGFRLPTIRAMEEDVKEWEKYMRRYSGQHFRKCSISLVHVWYNDQLCRDMGCNPRRKKGLLADWFIPYTAADYNISAT